MMVSQPSLCTATIYHQIIMVVCIYSGKDKCSSAGGIVAIYE